MMKPGSGFAVGTNQVTVLMRDGSVTELPQMSKEDVARRILDIALGEKRKAAETGTETKTVNNNP